MSDTEISFGRETLTISLPRGELTQIELAAERESRTKSAVVRRALIAAGVITPKETSVVQDPKNS